MDARRFAKRHLAAVGIGALALGIGSGVLLEGALHKTSPLYEVHEFGHVYKFINPLLSCGDNFSTLNNGKLDELENKMKDAIDAHTNAGDISEASVYFRMLNGGQSFGINANDTFAPGSLLKVPFAIGIYHLSHDDPGILTKKIEYTGTEVNDPQFFAPKPLPPGTYTTEELIDQMLTNSDNDAANALAMSMPLDAFTDTYQALGITVPPTQGDDYTTTTRTYASFFRILYNATYLDHEQSEHVLSLLAATTFKNGIVAGVPSGVPVAHKFGERAYSDSGTLQLHDCGIVYAPTQPFVVCIMTKGTDYDAMAAAIADITRLGYAYAE